MAKVDFVSLYSHDGWMLTIRGRGEDQAVQYELSEIQAALLATRFAAGWEDRERKRMAELST